MRFYLASWGGDGSDTNRYRPTIADSNWAAVDLRPDSTRQEGRTLLASRERLTRLPRGVIDLGDDLDDRSPAVRKSLGNQLSLSLDHQTLRGMIAELLILHGDARPREARSRWRGLKQTHDGRHRISMLGETIYDAPVPVLATITDDFDRADGSLGSSSEGWSWGETSGTGQFRILSNLVDNIPAGTGVASDARAEIDLDTDDHYAEADVTWHDTFAANGGVIVRFSSSARDYYYGSGSAGEDDVQIEKSTAGVHSSLALNNETIGAETLHIYFEVDGSGLSLTVGAFTPLTVTDTDITGHLRVGIGGEQGGTTGRTQKWNNFEAGDLVAVPTFPDAPTGLTATPVSVSQIDLDWDDLTGATAGYDVERDGVVIATNHGSSSYSDTGLDPSTEYDYRVRGKA